MLWVELWLRAVRHPELRPTAEKLYARMREWFAAAIAAGIEAGEFRAGGDPEAMADRALALIDGFGVRALLGTRGVARARPAPRSGRDFLAQALGLRAASPPT